MRFRTSLLFSLLFIAQFNNAFAEDIDQSSAISSSTKETSSANTIKKAVSTSTAFFEKFASFDGKKFYKSDGYSNGGDFSTAWRADHITVGNGVMQLQLDNQPCLKNKADCSNEKYASGEYNTHSLYKYGCYTVRMKATKESGTVSSLFTYSNTQDEIDIEILGKNPRQMQANYFLKGKPSGKAKLINLGFDSSAGFHTYQFYWASNKITWYIDGKQVYSVTGKVPDTASTIITNLWTGDKNQGVIDWMGAFSYKAPVKAYYTAMGYDPQDCVSVFNKNKPTTAQLQKEAQIIKGQ